MLACRLHSKLVMSWSGFNVVSRWEEANLGAERREIAAALRGACNHRPFDAQRIGETNGRETGRRTARGRGGNHQSTKVSGPNERTGLGVIRTRGGRFVMGASRPSLSGPASAA